MQKIALAAAAPEQGDPVETPMGNAASLLQNLKQQLQSLDDLRRYLSDESIVNMASTEDHAFDGELGKAVDAVGSTFNAMNDLIFAVETAFGIQKD